MTHVTSEGAGLSRRQLLTGPRVETQLEPQLLDALVLHLRRDPTKLPDAGLLRQHDARVDAVYRTKTGAERRRALDRENGRLAAHLGIAGIVTRALREHPAVEARLSRVILAASRPGEQRVDVHGPDAGGRLSLVVRLEVEVWQDPRAQLRYLRHELLHAADMMDPDFAYDAAAAWPGATHGQRRQTRGRFTALWCGTVDARLARAGHEPVAAPHVYRSELARLFAPASPAEVDALVAELARAQRFTHAELLLRAGVSYQAADGRSASGAPCALCGFPSSDWAAPGALAGAAERAIQRDFPVWQPPDGCCVRCLECYESQGRVR